MATNEIESAEIKAIEPIEMDRGCNNLLFRYSEASGSDIVGDDVFQIAAASEFPGLQRASADHARLGIAKEGERFTEILSHEKGDADLSFFNSGRAAFLDEHKDNRQLGKIKKATLSSDKVTRLLVQCDGATKLSKSRKTQLQKKSRVNVSCGYVHTRYLGAVKLQDGTIGHRFAWQGREVSSVADPLDTTVGLERASAVDKCACFGCGKQMKSSDMVRDEGALYCSQDCIDAESPAEDATETENERMKKEKVSRHLLENTKLARDGGDKVTVSELANQVSEAVRQDPRFTGKDNKGNTTGWCYINDIYYDEDAKQWSAIMYCGTDSKTYEIKLDSADGKVTLGDAVEVVGKVKYEPVSTEENRKQTRSQVDSHELAKVEETKTEPIPNKFMAETTTAPVAPVVDEKQIRSAARVEVENEYKARDSKKENRDKEIRARATEFLKTYGQNWAGKPGEVVHVSERIRAFADEAIQAPADADPNLSIMDFTRKADELCRSSNAPLPQQEAATLEDSLASRVSLRRVFDEAEKANNRGQRSACFMLSDGAEFEADRELRNKAKYYPGGAGAPQDGLLFPNNVRVPLTSAMRSNVSRMTRDSLASDFGSAGALVAPEYMTPIELLRNKMALGRAGITVFSGVVGNLVFPRLAAPTTSQSLAEGAILASYDQVFDQVKMNPKRIGSTQNYSRLALAQASSNLEAIIYDDHMTVNALRADYLGINGSGANDEPLGILNQLGIGVVPFAGSAANAYKNCVALETAIRDANIDEPPVYITTPKSRGCLRITPATLTGSTVVSGSTNALWVGEEIVGRPAVDSKQVPGDVLIALVARHLMLASWAGMSIILDTITLAKQDKYVLTMNQYIDYALRHPQAVARSADTVATLA